MMTPWIKENAVWIAALLQYGAGTAISDASVLWDSVAQKLREVEARGQTNDWHRAIRRVIECQDDKELHALIIRLNAIMLGHISSRKKAKSSRRNGALGGRPPKTKHK